MLYRSQKLYHINMKRIDLHVHNKAIKGKDNGTKRNIGHDDFKNIMKEAGVGIAAITNHNVFDMSFFEPYKDEQYLLLPGIEIDIRKNEEKFQSNIIVDEENTKLLIKLTEEIGASDTNDIDFEVLMELLKEEKTIMFMDFKNGKTNVGIQTYHEIKEKLPLSACILDSPSGKVQRLLQANNFDSLVGSDVMD